MEWQWELQLMPGPKQDEDEDPILMTTLNNSVQEIHYNSPLGFMSHRNIMKQRQLQNMSCIKAIWMKTKWKKRVLGK